MNSEKQNIALRYWLLGANFNMALKAFEYGKKLHTGFRKDKVTPEFDHQVSITLFLKTFLKDCLSPEETLTASLLHDTPEDKEIGFEEIGYNFGPVVEKSVFLLTKKHRGVKVLPEVYYANIAKDPIASIVKGGDRINNISTMIGVFTIEKQKLYIEETESLILPMLKEARRSFPQQESIYENIKFNLQNQIKLMKAIHLAQKSS